MDVATKMVSPQTTGLEWPRPGIGVFQRTAWFLPTSQVTGAGWRSSIPAARMPRNCGQSMPGRGVDAPEKMNNRREDRCDGTKRSFELLEPLVKVRPPRLLGRDLVCQRVFLAREPLHVGIRLADFALRALHLHGEHSATLFDGRIRVRSGHLTLAGQHAFQACDLFLQFSGAALGAGELNADLREAAVRRVEPLLLKLQASECELHRRQRRSSVLSRRGDRALPRATPA